MARTTGSSEIAIALIDGPVADGHPDLREARIVHGAAGACAITDSGACGHGTFVAGMLAAERGSPAPAICPGCTLLVRPIFAEFESDGPVPAASPEQLAQALVESVRSGARLVNLSAATAYPTIPAERSLTEALEYAAARGVLIVAAAGNQGTLGSSAITRHSGVIPVVAYDLRGRPLADSNLGASAGRRGLGSPGEAIVSTAAGGGAATRSGTSFATAFVTGAAALLWSLLPALDAGRLRSALLGAERRHSVIPPLLDAEAAYRRLFARPEHIDSGPTFGSSSSPRDRAASVTVASMPEIVEDRASDTPVESEEPGPASTPIHHAEPRSADAEPLAPAVATQTSQPEPDVAAPTSQPASFVYALGQIDWRFPSLAVEKEFAQATASADTAGHSDHHVQSAALVKPELKYLVRQLCWVFVVGGLETYILTPHDPEDFGLLAASVRPSYDPGDVDAVIGVRGPIAPPEMCNGLALPIVVFDQIYSFDRQTLITSIPLPEEEEEVDEPGFRSAAGELFNKIIDLADNAGATDEYRALNYLAVRYPRIYTIATVMQQNNYGFTGIDVRRSPVTTARTVLDVIFSYTHRTTDVVEKQFVRVDTTEEWPFLVKKMGPYFQA